MTIGRRQTKTMADDGAQQMAALFRQITDNLRAEIAKHRNRPFLEAAMAASASIAIADGRGEFL